MKRSGFHNFAEECKQLNIKQTNFILKIMYYYFYQKLTKIST